MPGSVHIKGTLAPRLGNPTTSLDSRVEALESRFCVIDKSILVWFTLFHISIPGVFFFRKFNSLICHTVYKSKYKEAIQRT